LPVILDLAASHGPELLARKAKSLQRADKTQLEKLIRSRLSASGESHFADIFFAEACLQPLAENLQVQIAEVANYAKSVCPVCGGSPQAAVLRPEGEGRLRSLLCSFCLREWIFRRVVCPWCGQEDKEKLPLYSAEECTHVRIEACDICKRYQKAIDLSVDGHASPLVDEVGTAVLDVWATENGYCKISRNLMGF
jgi:FdhE protein